MQSACVCRKQELDGVSGRKGQTLMMVVTALITWQPTPAEHVCAQQRSFLGPSRPVRGVLLVRG